MFQELTASLFQNEVLTADRPVLVDFWAPGCPPCRLQEAVLKELDSETEGRFQVTKINVWDEPELATQFHVNAVPTLLIFNKGEVVQSLVGYQDKARLLRALHEAI